LIIWWERCIDTQGGDLAVLGNRFPACGHTAFRRPGQGGESRGRRWAGGLWAGDGCLGAGGGAPSLAVQWGGQGPRRRWPTKPWLPELSCRAFGFASGLAAGRKPRGGGPSLLDGVGGGAGALAAAGGDHKKGRRELMSFAMLGPTAAAPTTHPWVCAWACSRARVLPPCSWAWLAGSWVRGGGPPRQGRLGLARPAGGEFVLEAESENG